MTDLPLSVPAGSTPLTLGQKRLRLMTLLEAERAKRDLFEQRSRRNQDRDAAIIYDQLLGQQQRIIATLEKRVAALTDRLEGPELRQRLQQVEAELAEATQTIQRLQREMDETISARMQAEANEQLLAAQVQNLQELNDNYVNQIATLSLHERQNAEDHAHAVLTVSRILAKRGLTIPAKACSAARQDMDWSKVVDEDEIFAADARFDQTIFSARSRMGDTTRVLSLVINSVTPDLEMSPIELKLTELDLRNRQHTTKLLQGFPMANAIAAAETFVVTYQQIVGQK